MENTTLSWNVKEECAICGLIEAHSLVYSCPKYHKICEYCYKELSFIAQAKKRPVFCALCKTNGLLLEYKLHSSSNRPHEIEEQIEEDEDKIFEARIGMSKEKFYQQQQLFQKECRSKKNIKSGEKSKVNLPLPSKRPLKCPHHLCRKTVAVAQFVNHFRLEHNDVEIISAEKGKEVVLFFNVTRIVHGQHICLSMLTVYEVNQIDLQTFSSVSVAKTFNKFSQKVPVDTFWLMVTGSKETKTNMSYCVFWLFTNSDDIHHCTLELGSQRDSMSLSTVCAVSSAIDSKDFSSVLRNLRCLLVTKVTLKAMLREGILLNLRVTVH
ncbi:uncharacterized protein LOC143190945 [Rhynchophorus ferrugineus]|uniref:DUF4729 domain-containing protein n=1 Tax=Rhynchophorus ferrugineus TaxID=354439 RepID=A0A834J210_RHYFE|nr:hypothetical protein GWI33_010152 [Rhynchophorus ferrugineus]